MAYDEPLEELKRLAAAGGDRVNNPDVGRQYVVWMPMSEGQPPSSAAEPPSDLT